MGGNALMGVLASIHRFPKKLQSNFARVHAYEVGRLASLGLITTREGEGYGHSWRVTYKGLRVLELGEPE